MASLYVKRYIINKIVKIESSKHFCAFIDFKKAYDKINRNLLLLKLQRIGIGGLFYKNIKVMYHSVSYILKLNNGVLDP